MTNDEHGLPLEGSRDEEARMGTEKKKYMQQPTTLALEFRAGEGTPFLSASMPRRLGRTTRGHRSECSAEEKDEERVDRRRVEKGV